VGPFCKSRSGESGIVDVLLGIPVSLQRGSPRFIFPISPHGTTNITLRWMAAANAICGPKQAAEFAKLNWATDWRLCPLQIAGASPRLANTGAALMECHHRKIHKGGRQRIALRVSAASSHSACRGVRRLAVRDESLQFVQYSIAER